MIPFYLIQVRHYPPPAAGAVFLPLILIMFLFSARVGALVPRVGERLLLCLGAALAGIGFAAFAWLDKQHGYALSILPPVLLLGCGMTLCVAPLTNAVMSSVPPTQTGIASAVNNALSRLAGLLAVSLLALVLAHGFVSSLTSQLAHSTLPSEVRETDAGQPGSPARHPDPAKPHPAAASPGRALSRSGLSRRISLRDAGLRPQRLGRRSAVLFLLPKPPTEKLDAEPTAT